jgi:ribosomal protein S18 acetylase RimI-like enzyme
MEAARAATVADLPTLVALARSALEELRPTRGGELWARREARVEPLEDGLASALDDPARVVVVGTLDAVVVGYAVVRREVLRDGGVLGAIDDLYVEPAARGVGVGEAVMDQVLAWCRRNGCEGIDAIALPGNRAAKNFFERFGLVARAIVVHRDLRAAP